MCSIDPYAEPGKSQGIRRGGRLCPPAENPVFTETFGEFATSLGRTGSSAPYEPHGSASKQGRFGILGLLQKRFDVALAEDLDAVFLEKRRGHAVAGGELAGKGSVVNFA